MYVSETKIRVRYNETDKMGYVYHGNYPTYYHIGRTELFRKIGISDKELEENGILIIVIETNIKYLKPAYYDDLLTIKTYIKNKSRVRIVFYFEIFNAQNKLINMGDSTVVFVDNKTRKPWVIPEILEKKLKQIIIKC